MSEPKISIIIPVYNSEKYLKECLDSCINQTLEDIEIICVDDCSTDNSYKILEEYLQKDSRIRIFRQETNKKQGAARNKGLEIATGEYVWFVDSDDYIDTKACQILYDAIKEFDVDMLCFSALQFSEGDGTRKFFYPKHFQGVQINKVYHPQTNWKEITFYSLNVVVHGYITKKDIIQKLKFREGVFYEDQDFTPILLASVDSFCYIPYSPYFYRTNPTSTTHLQLTQKVLEDLISSTINLSKFVAQNNIPPKHFLHIYYLNFLAYIVYYYKDNSTLAPQNADCLMMLEQKYQNDLNKIHPKQKKYSLTRFVGKVFTKILKATQKAENKEKYIVTNKNTKKWVFVSYIPYVFYEKDISKRLAHQNQNEMIAIVDVLKRLGYNVYVMAYNSTDVLPDIDVSIVFGLEPVFARACEKYSNARKIYYATGAYYQHQNNMVISMTDEFNKIFNTNIPYRRLVSPHNSCEISDSILQIGGNFTIDTYPPHLRSKIYTIHQSSQATASNTLNYAKENEYVFMGSGGNILKGLWLLIDFFCHNADFTLNIVGPIEDDVLEIIRSKITPNIKIHGYLNVNSEVLHDILKRCNFIIYPSGSEGCPGAVLNMMKKGMVPIVSRWAAFDEIKDYGFLLTGLDKESIHAAIEWSSKLTEEKISEMKKRASKFVCDTYSLERFSAEFEEFIKKQAQNSPVEQNILENKE